MYHIIVTRFNLVFERWSTDRNNSPVLTASWLDQRFELFQNYCFPSVKNQTNQNFKWLVFFDIRTPEHYKDVIKSLEKSYINFIPIFIDEHNSLERELLLFVGKNKINESFILTTRIDNDDIIHCEFVNTIRQLALEKHNTIIDIRKGYQMVLNERIEEYRLTEQKFNPFISLVQEWMQFESIYKRQHTDWHSAENVRIYNESPLWIQVLHGRNKLNSLNRHNRLVLEVNYPSFGISKKKKTRSWMYVKSYNLLLNILETVKKY